MQGKHESRRDYLTLQALEPDGSAGTVQISFERMQAVGKRSMAHAKECGIIVPGILQEPTAIFEGLRSDEDEDPRARCGMAMLLRRARTGILSRRDGSIAVSGTSISGVRQR
jgi:hypothetical protein